MRPDQIANPASGPLSQYTPTTSNLQSTKDKIKKKSFSNEQLTKVPDNYEIKQKFTRTDMLAGDLRPP